MLLESMIITAMHLALILDLLCPHCSHVYSTMCGCDKPSAHHSAAIEVQPYLKVGLQELHHTHRTKRMHGVCQLNRIAAKGLHDVSAAMLHSRKRHTQNAGHSRMCNIHTVQPMHSRTVHTRERKFVVKGGAGMCDDRTHSCSITCSQ